MSIATDCARRNYERALEIANWSGHDSALDLRRIEETAELYRACQEIDEMHRRFEEKQK